MSADTDRLRLAVLGVVVVSLFAALFARLWYLQVMDSTAFKVAAEANQVRLVYEEAPRGRVLDRQGRVLVDNVVTAVVSVNRAELVPERQPAVVARLAALLAMAPDQLKERIADPRYSPYKPVPVAEGVEEWKLVYIREHQADFPGVSGSDLAVRAYPNGNIAAHVLGYVGEINDEELKASAGGEYHRGDSIGKTGVERTYESDLRGDVGVTKLEVNVRGRVLRTLDAKPPVNGNDVQLTLDLDVQRLTEESLQQGIEAAQRTFDRDTKKHFIAPAGAAVVMDPRDGSVLAMASFPTFDPGAFVNGISREFFRQLQDPTSHFPLNNRAIQGQYAPGSTFKLVTALAAMRKGLITDRTTFDDTGSYKIHNCRGDKCIFRNAGSRSFGRVNLSSALTVSSDVFFYDLGANFWFQRDRFGDAVQETARDLGLAERTGVNLPSEAHGRVPDPESRRRLHLAKPRAFPNGNWYAGDNVNLAVGQGETVATPVQLATAYATFANGGSVLQPRVAARVVDPEGRPVRNEGSHEVRRVEISPVARNAVMRGLRGAVADDKGTASGAFAGFDVPGFGVAGKTGTAQVHGKQDTALFVGLAPYDNPQYVVAVVMEEAGFGGSAAAPVARRIFQGLAGQPVGPVTLAGGVD